MRAGVERLLVLAVACGVLLVAGLWEQFSHRRRLRRIPVRIHVNGTRGKSTTTRLIAAGLRSGGLKVIAKTTGTEPCLILEDGSEQPIRRRGAVNIIEQVRTVAFAAARGADAVVIECMALQPENQWVSEHRMIRATIGVITNVRADHLDVMGPAVADVAEALSLTIPAGGALVTAEVDAFEALARRAEKLRTTVHQVFAAEVPDETNESFPYLSFKENVACALKVCALAGVDTDTALRGMLSANGDAGVSRIERLVRHGRYYYLVDAFAANDPTSALMVWERVRAMVPSELPVVAALNNRADRMLRIGEFASLLAQGIRSDQIVLIGDAGLLARRHLLRHGMDPARVHDLTRVRTAEGVLAGIGRLAPDGAVILALGNTKGIGRELTAAFEEGGEVAG